MSKPYKDECSLWFCHNTLYAKSFCRKHYTNMLRFGTPIAPSNLDFRAAVKFWNETVEAMAHNEHEKVREMLDLYTGQKFK